MSHTKIDPSSPGQSSQGDEHCDPHGHIGSMSPSGHEGLGRDGEGNFQSMARGGESEHGDDMVNKYRPGKGSAPKPFGGSAGELNSKLDNDEDD